MQSPKHLIDMHTHMFNARYLPLRGIAISRKIPSRLAGLFARLCWALTHLSDFDVTLEETPELIASYWKDGGAELNFLRARSKSKNRKNSEFEKNSPNHDHDHDNETLIDEYITVLAHNSVSLYFLSQKSATSRNWFSATSKKTAPQYELLREQIYMIFSDIHALFGDDESARELEHFVEPLRTPSIKISKIPNWGWGLLNMIKELFKKIIAAVDDVIDFLDFAWNMTQPEERLLERLQKYYTERNIPFMLVHYMMDMEYPYRLMNGRKKDGEVKLFYYTDNSEDASQLKQMRQLALKSNGTLLGFSAFDPTRFLKTQYSDLEIIQHLEKAMSHGMIGFKFYPPLGFKPAGNKNDRLEKIIDVFLDYCVAKDICVFTHCTPKGFQLIPSEETGKLAHPKYWRDALKKPGRKHLRLCFGHAGGGYYNLKASKLISHGWLAESPIEWNHEDNFAAEVVKLCREFPNVYCELANIDVILEDSEAREAMAKNLKDQLTTHDLPCPYELKDKIMYGTDWHMVGMVNDLLSYFDRLLEMFNQKELQPLIEPFFNGNALRYLKNQNKFAEQAFSSFTERLNEKNYTV